MSNRVDNLFNKILAIEEVESINLGGMVELIDGRTQITLQVYLEKFEETLGIHVKEEVGTEDIFGGK